MIKSAVGLFAFVLSGLLAQSAGAASIVDQGNTTLDNVTHLEWLDLGETQGLSFDDVTANNGVNFISQGWRYATQTELGQLFGDAGLPGLNFQTTTNKPLYDDAAFLFSSLGLLNPASEILAGGVSVPTKYSFGITAEAGFPNAQFLEAGDNGGSSYVVISSATFLPHGTPSSEAGSFLVRTAAVTPIPAALPLFLTGIAGLGFLGRRRKMTGA